jgi:hypothetical protein
MYKIFLFYSVFFLIALIYLKKYEKFTTTAEPKDPGVTTKSQIELAEINKDNNILKYNINKTVFSEINENVVKMFVFNEASSKIFLKLDMTSIPNNLSNYTKTKGFCRDFVSSIYNIETWPAYLETTSENENINDSVDFCEKNSKCYGFSKYHNKKDNKYYYNFYGHTFNTNDAVENYTFYPAGGIPKGNTYIGSSNTLIGGSGFKDADCFIKKKHPKSNNYYVSFNLSFNYFLSENKTVIIESRIDYDSRSGPEWEIYVLNGRIYYSANNNEKRFNTDINISTDNNKKIHFVAIVHEDNKIKFFLDGEETEEINLTNISTQKIITFAGEGNNDLTSESDFRGYIGNIKYGFRKDSNKFDTNDIYQDELICKFIPQHKDEEKCIESCKKTPSCYVGECLYICKGCKDQIQCPWIKTSTQDDYKTTQVWPDPPNPIRTLPGDKRIILEWKKPFEGVHGVIKSYIITVKESYPIDNHGHEQMIYNFKSNNCVNCQYEIQNLKNTVYYDISVKSQNEISDTNQNVQNYLSKDCSETAISAPIGPLNLNDYHPSLIESDETIKDLYDSGIENTGGSRNNCNDKINLYKNKYNFNSIKNEKEYDPNNETRIKGYSDEIKFFLSS